MKHSVYEHHRINNTLSQLPYTASTWVMATKIRNASGSMRQIRVFATVDDFEPRTIPVLYRIDMETELECFRRESPKFPTCNRRNNICVVSDDIFAQNDPLF